MVQGSDPDPANVLSTLGKRQARTLGRALLMDGVVPASAWSSPLPRARETRDITLKVMGCRLPVRNDPRLVEMCKGLRGLPGGMEGRRTDEVKTPAYREAYKRGGWDFRHGSVESKGETARETGRRVLTAMNDFADHLEADATGLVFMHGQAARYGVGGALGWPDIQQVDTDYRLGNCEGLIVNRNARKRWEFVGRMAAA